MPVAPPRKRTFSLDRVKVLGLIRMLAHWHHNDQLTPAQRKQLNLGLQRTLGEELSRLDDVVLPWAYAYVDEMEGEDTP